ncbi:MAG: DUF1080 domain-containing protein [Verrucomicrobia bacterium]|nr:DUF1080 domain-containing protein [Verrucomicrobiota bacterium]
MKTKYLILSALLSGSLFTSAADPYMGDWKGEIKLQNQPSKSVAVYMIPRGNGRYDAKIVSEFNKRVPTLFRLSGNINSDKFALLNSIPMTPSKVIRATEDGVVFDTALWSGAPDNSSVNGDIAGRIKGEFKLKQTKRLSPTLGKKPPQGAVVLFDGSNLDAWQSTDDDPVEWKLVDGAMEVNGGNIVSKTKYKDTKLHIEFRTPYMPWASGQGRGNSGVYLQGRYEVQVLDSYGLEGEDNECGGIYQVGKPLVNMCAPPLQWQTYDITFKAARFDESGNKLENAVVTIVHNGVVIHENLEIPGPTGGALNENEQEAGGLMLQDHGNPVQYRNIWLKKL